MNMKNKLYVSAGAVAILASLSVPVFASDGTINITGTIVGTTCTVKGGSGSNGDVSVALDKVSVGSLSTLGATAGFKPFSISLSGCGGAAGGQIVAKAGFEPGPNTDIASGRLNLDTGSTAKNVQLQLRNLDNSVIKIGDSATAGAVTFNASASIANLSYLVGYYATGQATAGNANSSLTYSIVYQ